MSLVIVTKNQYIIASKIHHIVLNEGYEYHDVRNSAGRMIGVRENTYQIHIIYTPDSSSNNNGRGEERHDCTVTMRGKVDAYKVYKDLIRQIREQMPDALFLNTALERLLSDADFEAIANSEEQDKLECMEIMKDDRRTKKVRKSRKAKRASKKVLRRAKRRR